MDGLIVFSDGGSRGNPGPAAIGFVLKDKAGKVVYRAGRFIGLATNNCAEYVALTEALKKAHELGSKEVTCFLDSELVVRQLNGQYKVKDENIRRHFANIVSVVKVLGKVSFNHVTRDKNYEADKLVNLALDTQEKIIHGQC